MVPSWAGTSKLAPFFWHIMLAIIETSVVWVRASIVDEDIEGIDFGGDVLECCFDGLVVCDIELDAVDGAAGFGDFGLDFLDGCFYFLGITAAEVYFVGDCGLAEGFDGFVADSGVGASDEHDFGGHIECL